MPALEATLSRGNFDLSRSRDIALGAHSLTGNFLEACLIAAGVVLLAIGIYYLCKKRFWCYLYRRR